MMMAAGKRWGFALLLAGFALVATAPVAATDAAIAEPGALPAYDVSVIRLSASGDGDHHVNTRLNTLEVRNEPVTDLLQSAFDVPRDMILGLPAWAQGARLDIDAKTLEPDPARMRRLTAEQRRAMLQSLLKDRLGLRWHYETRVLETYDLTVAKGGPKLQATGAKGGNGGVSVNDTKLKATNIAVSGLAIVLADKLGRPVVDKTGLAGRYDLDLQWTADNEPGSGGAKGGANGEADAPPPLFIAVAEQLGLKLQAGKDSVQVFVIDQLTQPTPN